MRKVVSNTTPILALIKVDKLFLLKDLFGNIYIPKAVYNEIEEGKTKPYYHDLKLESWIKILDIENRQPLNFLFDLDKGEAEAITLAKEIKADLLLLDEKEGRRYANLLDLPIAGTIGLLIKAKDKGLLGSVKEILLELVEKGIWIKPSLYDKVLKLTDEKE